MQWREGQSCACLEKLEIDIVANIPSIIDNTLNVTRYHTACKLPTLLALLSQILGLLCNLIPSQ